MITRYQLIIQNISKYRLEGNAKLLKLWKQKLAQWQKEYGAYAPIQ